MDEGAFETLASEMLENLFDQADEALGDEMDIDLEGGILTITLASGGQYVINKNAPNRQIWLSSPSSGAAHFSHDEQSGRWLSTRSEDDLLDLLGGELSKAAGRDFAFG
ncbi:MAG: iron donor protein CyaY [Rhodospirillales bacterium]|nr:iron donor protein CyaY [Rhodospirillales bacterium]MCW8861765.1 iron donor protein CyaY [Rhodospirillales bacterium]MCW9040235.1 iron donor protein CyaY [Rhodospirillales bacterium]